MSRALSLSQGLPSFASNDSDDKIPESNGDGNTVDGVNLEESSTDFWAMDGQRTYYNDLEGAISIRDHGSDFMPEGVDRPVASLSGSANPATRVAMSSPPAPSVPPAPPPSEHYFTLSHPLKLTEIRKLLRSETGEGTLLDLEASKVPRMLDLLHEEIKSNSLDYQYRRKCGKCLRLLVDKHHVLPPSLFLKGKKITNKGKSPLAVGGYSDVYGGTFGGRPVCLKVLRAHVEADEERRNKDLRDFYREALLWTRLNHPNLLPFLGVNATLFPGRLCLVSPWMANGQVTMFLKSNPNYDKLKMISEIAAGVFYLHSRNIVHGDIKGANILVDEHRQCYLADFGLAIASMTTTLLSTTTTNAAKGTIRWMAPELFLDDASNSTGSEKVHENLKRKNVKLAGDIYAYACTVYEIMAGNVPFADLSEVQVMFKVMNGVRPKRPTESVNRCPNNIWALVERCWAQESHLRPTAASVNKFLSRLGQLRRDGLPSREEFLD